MTFADRLKSPLPFVLGAVFAAINLIAVGGAILESPQGGEGFAIVIAAYDWPLLALCQFFKFLCYGASNDHYSVLLISGTLIYALGGFATGIAIVYIRALIARRWD